MLYTTYYDSPLGIFEIGGSNSGIQSVKLIDKMKKEDLGHKSTLLQKCAKQLDEYFNGSRKEFDLKLDWSSATKFHHSVWSELIQIPYGKTTTYSYIAKKLDNPKAVRAVGLANKLNPIAIIVPCHRVIAKSGHLQGYFYGLDKKRYLLQLENPMQFAKQGNLFQQ